MPVNYNIAMYSNPQDENAVKILLKSIKAGGDIWKGIYRKFTPVASTLESFSVEDGRVPVGVNLFKFQSLAGINDPPCQSMFLRVKADAHFYHRQPIECKTFGILLQVNLRHSCTSRLIQLQLNDIQYLRCTHHHIHPSLGSTNLYIDIHVKKGKNDVKQLLIMPFVMGVITIRHRGKKLHSSLAKRQVALYIRPSVPTFPLG